MLGSTMSSECRSSRRRRSQSCSPGYRGRVGEAPLRPVQYISPPADLRAGPRGNRRADEIAVAPDGRTTYVASGVGSLGSVGVLARDARTQRLRPLQCVARHAAACTSGRGLERRPRSPSRPTAAPSTSPPQTGAPSACIAALRAVGSPQPAPSTASTTRARSRSHPTAPICTSAATGSGSSRARPPARCAPAGAEPGPANAVAISSDGSFVYSAGGGGPARTLVTWRRDPQTGALTQVQALCSLGDSDCARGTGLLQPSALALSPDGSTLWVAAIGSQGVTAYARDAATGMLASGAQRSDLPAAADVAAAGHRVYVAFRDGLAILPTDLRTKEIVPLRRAAAVALAGRGVYVASSRRVTVLAR